MIDRGPQLLSPEERDVADEVRRILESEDIQVLPEADLAPSGSA